MKSALIVIDMQNSLLAMGPYQANELCLTLENTVYAAQAASVPVFFILDRRVQPDMGLHGGFTVTAQDVLIEKDYCDSFLETRLQYELDSRGIRQLVIGGLQTEFCVDTTSRRAASLGYSVFLMGDAHSTFNNGALSAEQIIEHENITLQDFPAGHGQVMVVEHTQISFAE